MLAPSANISNGSEVKFVMTAVNVLFGVDKIASISKHLHP